MLHRLRLAIHAKSFDKFGGTVEVDETFIGDKGRNMHAAKRKRLTYVALTGKQLLETC
jgi:hypothetical protein